MCPSFFFCFPWAPLFKSISDMEPQPLPFEKPLLDLRRQLDELKRHSGESAVDVEVEIRAIEKKIAVTRQEIYRELSPWQRVQIARHTGRPFALDFVETCFTDFVELHGDRVFGDDPSMPAGLATLNGRRCVVLSHQKGRNLKENLHRNFGSPHPEGYRKALRLMRLADKFRLPIVSLIDTPGAYPGVGAEERHIAEAIAVNLREMMRFEVPVVAVVIGEGGSGGALGIGVANRVLIMENAYYSVISPEACSAILWKDRKHGAEAADALRLTASHLLDLQLVDEVIPEPEGGAHNDPAAACQAVGEALDRHLTALIQLSGGELRTQRYEKFRHFGTFVEETVVAPHPKGGTAGS